MNLLKSFWDDESGQALSEYGVILGIILVGVIGVIVTFRETIMGVFQSIVEQLGNI
ncbi:Flp family type IVb pilin [Alteribacter populi]|uniref:Flp family type IVb pilin n=1 Tax=Alteribacter populi TaxID=2011011 RepID=UPI000BBA43F1|nr:Flp family type IVb pilin [Alteribacter populi]